ncbi:MAG TPA: DNA-directed RNA polymerase subunit alpha, partial [Bacteroidales bacterium]|nr:DNA-directed RNA polymerase subunit alpha [Bacteroidales bacterium]
LSSIEGYAITLVKIEGVDHEFSTIKGVIEDVTDIILNLKQIRFKRKIENIETEKIVLKLQGKEVFKAGDLDAVLNSFEVLNPDLVVCRMEPDIKFSIELTISKGRGYVPAEENEPENAEFGLIAIDSIFTPIKNVKYSVENYRVEQKTDYEKLLIEIETDGSIHPKDALKEAAKILIYHFMLFSDEKITIDADEKLTSQEFDEEMLRMRQLLKTKLIDLDLSVRALNCLKAAEVETLGDLVKYNRNDLLKFRNFGKKSLIELDELLESMGLSFGMDVSKYKLDID